MNYNIKYCHCGNVIIRDGQRYCNSCHASWMRANRLKHKELDTEQRKKANARAYLHVYVKRKLVSKKPCVVCGKEKVEAHHENYNKPLDVSWYCRKHHIEYHNKKGADIKISARSL